MSLFLSTLNQKTPNKAEFTPKRVHSELSPDDSTEMTSNQVGNMDIRELMVHMQRTMANLLDEKLKNMATKDDLDAVKEYVSGLDQKIVTLAEENLQMKCTIAKLEKEKEKDHAELMRLIAENKKNNLIFRGIEREEASVHAGLAQSTAGSDAGIQEAAVHVNVAQSPEDAVKKVCREKLGVEVEVQHAKILLDKRKSMNVLAKLTEKSVYDIFKNIRKLRGSSISIERDLSQEKQQQKKALLYLKKKITQIDDTHRIKVLNDKMKIVGKWMNWGMGGKLYCGKEEAKKFLETIYGKKLMAIDFTFDAIINEMEKETLAKN